MGQVAIDRGRGVDAGWLMEAMTRMIRPVVRFAVGRVSCSALVDLVREIYVDEARNYLQNQNPERKVTRSALALICGMDGRAIQTFEQMSGRKYTPAELCSEAAILEAWMTDPDFLDAEKNEAAELLIYGPQGTFQRLVSRAAGRAVTPQTALDRLLDSGNVELDESGAYVRMINPYYILVPSSEQAAINAGSFAIDRLGRAVVHNSDRFGRTGPPWLQQDRWSLRIPKNRLDKVRGEIRELLLAHIDELEKFLENEEQRPSDTVECSVGIGWYYWEELSEDKSNSDHNAPKQTAA